MGRYVHTREQVIEFLKNSKKELDGYYEEFSKGFTDEKSCRLVIREANDVFTLTKRLALGEYEGGDGD